MILNYVMKDIMELIDTPFYFMQYVGKMGINKYSHLMQCIFTLHLICTLMFSWSNI